MDNSNNISMNGFSNSPRAHHEVFPAGLRVLVVDDDPTWLKILEKMLKKCSYEVTTCCLARDALDLLRERKDGFDIVISDVNMPDMDGFKLLEHVGLEMDLPVIMMSVDGETSRVMKGVQHGACDYLLKPIRMKELKNIWQHVFRKKIHEVRDIEGLEGIEEIQMMRNGLSDQSDDGYIFCGGDPNTGKKRKDFENRHDDKDYGDSSVVKKTRVVWTVDLHQKFVKAVNHIGFDKVGPKKILDLMNVPWLTRENVASHLQKYRLYLSRLQKENDLKTSFSGIKNPDIASKEQAGNIGFQDVKVKQKDAENSNYGIPSNIVIQNSYPKIYEGNGNGTVSLPTPEPNVAAIGDTHEIHKASSSGMRLQHTFGSLEPDTKFASFSSGIPPQYSWSTDGAQVQSKQEHSPHLELKNGFNHLLLPRLQNQIEVNNLQPQVQINHLQPTPSIYPAPFNKEPDKQTQIEIKAHYATKCSDEYIQHQTTRRNTFHMSPLQSESTIRRTFSMKNQVINQNLINDLDSSNGNLILGRGLPFTPLNVDLHAGFLQEDIFPSNFQLDNKEFLDYNNPELISEVPASLYDALRFDYEYPCEATGYAIIDQGLFIA